MIELDFVIEVKWKDGKDPDKWIKYSRNKSEAALREVLTFTLRKNWRRLAAWRLRRIGKNGAPLVILDSSEMRASGLSK